MPCAPSQSNSRKPVPSSRQTVALPPLQLALPGVQATQPSLSIVPVALKRELKHVWPLSEQSTEVLKPPLPSQTRASDPSHCTVSASHAKGARPLSPAPPSAAGLFTESSSHEQRVTLSR